MATETIYKPGFVKELFNQLSNSYDRVNLISSLGLSGLFRLQCIKQLKSSNHQMEILDLMTGMGENWKTAKNKFPNGKLSALDFSDEMLKLAQVKNQNEFGNSVIVLNQDLLENNLPGDHYDIVICAFGLKSFNEEQVKILAKETGRILKPGGQFSFIEISTPKNRVLKHLFGIYLGKFVPCISKLLRGNPGRYKMLWNYTKKFNNAEWVLNHFRQAGMSVTFHSYFYGCATGFSGNK